MKLKEIRKYLAGRFPRLDHNTVLNAIRFERGTIDFDPSTGSIFDEENELVSELYVARPLTYITLEKEDPTLREPNILRIFGFTRGLDVERGVLPNTVIIDIIEAKFGFRPRFGSSAGPDLHTILGWQASGLWRAGVQLFLVDDISQTAIDNGIEYADRLASLVSTINVEDIWRLGSKLRRFTEEDLASILTNLHARIFENEVANFLRRHHDYPQIETRHKPAYLRKEIDVFAANRVITGTSRVTICECKLTLDERPITNEELREFKKLADKVMTVEFDHIRKSGGQLKFNAWFVTNSRNLPKDALTSTDNEFRIMIATLPNNWMRMDNWKIVSLKQHEPSC